MKTGSLVFMKINGAVLVGETSSSFSSDSNAIDVSDKLSGRDTGLEYGRMNRTFTVSGIADTTPEIPLSLALTGTVSVTISTTAVTGVGTLFTTEIEEGESIKIASETFTVAAVISDTSLTLSSAHSAGASGVTAYRDPRIKGIKDALDYQEAGTKIDIVLTSYTDKTSDVRVVADTVLSGSAAITGISAEFGDDAAQTFSMTLQVDGALTVGVNPAL